LRDDALDNKYTSDYIDSEVTRLYHLQMLDEMTLNTRVQDSTKSINNLNRRSSDSQATFSQISTLSLTLNNTTIKSIETKRSDADSMDTGINLDITTIDTQNQPSPRITPQLDNDATTNKIATEQPPSSTFSSNNSAKNMVMNRAKIIKKQICELTIDEIHELNDELQIKYPVSIHGIILTSDNLKQSKWDNNDTVLNEIVSQTGCNKYSITEASITTDTIKHTTSLTIKIDDYEDYILVRDTRNWSQTSFGGSILSIKPLPIFISQNGFENNLEMTISVLPKNAMIASNKIAQCEAAYHLSGFVRITTADKTPTNRFKFIANHALAYVSACNDGIFLNSVKYFPEPNINHSGICQICTIANCRGSKKKPCQSKPRCHRCSETNHTDVTCKNQEYCINCQKKGHRATHDGHCPIYQQKTFDNNAFLIPLLVGEGIKINKFAILRNANIAMTNALNNNDETIINEDVVREMCNKYCDEKVLTRVTSLEINHQSLEAKCDNYAAAITVLQDTQKEMKSTLNTMQSTASKTGSDVEKILNLLTNSHQAKPGNAPPTPLGNI
jgi:hypothetical protein